MNSKYDANSIETLNFRDAVRKRIEMYMGSADNQGVLQCAREVISNSIDEFSIGFGNRVDIEIINGGFSCRDYEFSLTTQKDDDKKYYLGAFYTDEEIQRGIDLLNRWNHYIAGRLPFKQ